MFYNYERSVLGCGCNRKGCDALWPTLDHTSKPQIRPRRWLTVRRREKAMLLLDSFMRNWKQCKRVEEEASVTSLAAESCSPRGATKKRACSMLSTAQVTVGGCAPMSSEATQGLDKHVDRPCGSALLAAGPQRVSIVVTARWWRSTVSLVDSSCSSSQGRQHSPEYTRIMVCRQQRTRIGALNHTTCLAYKKAHHYSWQTCSRTRAPPPLQWASWGISLLVTDDTLDWFLNTPLSTRCENS